MSDNKKYYWLKLKRDFFKDKRMKKLRNIAGGDTYTIIYLKMQLLSLQDEGNLYFENVEDTFEEEIALEIDEDVENVKAVIAFLLRNNLLVQINEKYYELTETKLCIGSETRNAESMRNLRKRKKLLATENNKNVTMLQNVTKCYTEKEKEKEKELEIEKDIKYIVEQIVDYLNEKTGKKFKSNTSNTKKHIKARLNEGYTFEDFKKVIDTKTIDWLNNKDMNKYLRPETLFGTKFESYLNQQKKIFTTKDIENKIDFSDVL